MNGVGILISALNKTGPAIRAAEAGFRGLVNIVRGAASTMTTALTAPLRALFDIRTLLAGGGVAAGLATAVKKAFAVESSIAQFKVLTGDMSKAKAIYADLKSYADENPIYDLGETLQAGKLLMAFGVQTKDLMGVLRSLADVSAAVNMPLSEMADIVGRNIVQGRLFQIDLRQLQGRGVPIIAELAKIYGVAATEVMGMATAGKVSSNDMIAAFKAMTAEGGRFSGMVDELGKTGNGMFDRLKADWSSAVTEFGQQLEGTAKGGLQFLLDKLGELRASGAFEEWGKKVARVAEVAKGAISGIFGGDEKVMNASLGVVSAAIQDAFSAAVKVLSEAAPTIGKLIGAGFKNAVDLMPYTGDEKQIAIKQIMDSRHGPRDQFRGEVIGDWMSGDQINAQVRKNRERARLVDMGLDPDKPFGAGNSKTGEAYRLLQEVLVKGGYTKAPETLGNVYGEKGSMKDAGYDNFNPALETEAQKQLRENSLAIARLTEAIKTAKAEAGVLNAPGITGPAINKMEQELADRQTSTVRLAAKAQAERDQYRTKPGNAQGGAAGALPGAVSGGLDEDVRKAMGAAVFAGLSDAGKRYALSGEIKELAKKYAEAVAAGSEDAEGIGQKMAKARAERFNLLSPEDKERNLQGRVKYGAQALAAEQEKLERLKFLDQGQAGPSAVTKQQQAKVDGMVSVLQTMRTLLAEMAGARAGKANEGKAEAAKAEAAKIIEAGGTYRPGDTFDQWTKRKEKADKRAARAVDIATNRRGLGGLLDAPEQAYSEEMGWRRDARGFKHAAAKGAHFEDTSEDGIKMQGSRASGFRSFKRVADRPAWEQSLSLGDVFSSRFGQRPKAGQASPEERTAKATEEMRKILERQYATAENGKEK